MLGWRKKRDGFEWHDYVRTTILVRRAKRRQKVDDARAAAAHGLKEAGAAAAHGLHEARDKAADGLRRASEMGQAVGSSGAVAARHLLARLWQASWRGLINASTIAAAGVRRLAGGTMTLSAAGLAPVLDRLSDRRTRIAVSAVGISALIALGFRVWMIGFDRRAAFAGLLALFTLGPALLAERRRSDVTVRPAALGKANAGASGPDTGGPAFSMRLLSPALAWGAFAALMVLGVGSLIGPGPEPGRDPNTRTSDVARLPTTGAVTPAAPVPERSETPSELRGRARALSGDMLRIGRGTVRLGHIEAPEAGQTCTRENGKQWRCGAAARTALASLVRGAVIRCTLTGTSEKPGEIGVANGDCRKGEEDLAATLVRDGHVFAETGFFSRHSGLESEAKNARRGIWAGKAERPESFRAAAWQAAKQTAPDSCPIKGRISARSKVYVMPWMPGYDRVSIRSARGERWFCTEQEALAAGWRPAEAS
ncbi:MAG: thermonuclease family protein [Hyphomicrobiaceae bacterium]|nr:thermonuclease family protein [Hyphomicrobiaceae bacterium]MCC0007878.1 thermonuclease family protein [Hyphomicrobiaceae bacterium]